MMLESGHLLVLSIALLEVKPLLMATLEFHQEQVKLFHKPYKSSLTIQTKLLGTLMKSLGPSTKVVMGLLHQNCKPKNDSKIT